jgi:hypothetical protein
MRKEKRRKKGKGREEGRKEREGRKEVTWDIVSAMVS